MTDEDLMELHQEEMRLYGVYVKAMAEAPRKAPAARDAWLSLYHKLREALPPDKLRRLINESVPEHGRVKR